MWNVKINTLSIVFKTTLDFFEWAFVSNNYSKRIHGK